MIHNNMTECEVRNMTDKVQSLTAQLVEVGADIKNKKFYFWMSIVYSIFITGAVLCACYQRDQFKQGAIDRGVLQYNPTNGALQWVNQNK